MMDRLASLAVANSRRVLLVAGAILLVAAIGGLPIVGLLKSSLSDFQDPHSGSGQTWHTIERVTGEAPYFGVAAIVPSSGDVHVDSGAAKDAQHVVALLKAQRGFQRALDYPNTHLNELISRDGRETLVLAAFSTPARAMAAVSKLRPVLARSGVRFGGLDIAFSEINNNFASDLEKTEFIAFPLLLLLSLWVFRGLLAALLPLLVGSFTIILTFLALRAINVLTGLSVFAVDVVSGVGLGLAIDYSLFVLWRYREELAIQGDTRAAIARTLQTAGRTVLYSTLTVSCALAALLVFPLRFLYSMGVGGAVAALFAGVVSLIVLPAVLVALGPRINALSPTWLQRSAARSARVGENDMWSRLARGVMRHPGVIAIVSMVVLVSFALPAFHLKLAPADTRMLPSSFESRRVAEVISRDFASDGSQMITMVVHDPVSSAGAVTAFATGAEQIAGNQASELPPVYLGHSTWEVDMLPKGSSTSASNQRLVHRLRAMTSPQRPLVGGLTAWFIDQKAAIASHIPLALTILGIVTIGFLFMMTGSVVIPLKALAMNLLTVTVGFGILVLVFQDGHFTSLLGTHPVGGLEEANLLLLCVLAFSLSTDYGVFLFGRIKEAHDGGESNRDAVAFGIARTGRLITAAAMLLCVAVGSFITSDIFFVKQFAFGTALAVVIDATFVRALLVPSLMAILGDWNWWAPRWLLRIHARARLDHSDFHSLPDGHRHAVPELVQPDPASSELAAELHSGQ